MARHNGRYCAARAAAHIPRLAMGCVALAVLLVPVEAQAQVGDSLGDRLDRDLTETDLMQDDQSTFLTPAPIAAMYLTKGEVDVGLKGAAAHYAPRAGTSNETASLYGGALIATVSLSDRFFATVGGIYSKGSSENLGAQISGGLAGGGGRFLGDKDDIYAVSAAAVVAVAHSRVELDPIADRSNRTRAIEVSGLGAGATLQGGFWPIRWVGLIPHVSVYRLLKVKVARDGKEGHKHDLRMQWLVPGLDIWIHLNPNDRGSYIALSGSTTIGQESRTSLFTLGYTFSFGGGEQDAPVSDEPEPANADPDPDPNPVTNG